MNINKPQIHSAGSAVSSIQGQPDAGPNTSKINSSPDTSQSRLGEMRATVGAYQADE